MRRKYDSPIATRLGVSPGMLAELGSALLRETKGDPPFVMGTAGQGLVRRGLAERGKPSWEMRINAAGRALFERARKMGW